MSLTVDVCGSCEAQAMEYAVEHRIVATVAEVPLFADLRASLSNATLKEYFNNCP